VDSLSLRSPQKKSYNRDGPQSDISFLMHIEAHCAPHKEQEGEHLPAREPRAEQEAQEEAQHDEIERKTLPALREEVAAHEAEEQDENIAEAGASD